MTGKYSIGGWGVVSSRDGYRKLVKITRLSTSSVYVDDIRYRLRDGLEIGSNGVRYIRPLTDEQRERMDKAIYRKTLISRVSVQCSKYALNKMTLDKLEQLNAILGNM